MYTVTVQPSANVHSEPHFLMDQLPATTWLVAIVHFYPFRGIGQTHTHGALCDKKDDGSVQTLLLGHPRRGGLYRSACPSVCLSVCLSVVIVCVRRSVGRSVGRSKDYG